MQEELVVLVVLGLFGLLIGALVVALIAWSRITALTARVATLERERAAQRRAGAAALESSAPAGVEHERTTPEPAQPSVAPAPLPIVPPQRAHIEAPESVPSNWPEREPDAPTHASSARDWSSSASVPPPAPISAAPADVPVTSAAAAARAASANKTGRDGLERWLGVRGAALLGGIFLAFAGFLFFRYSIERGWLGPTTRVVLGVVTGIACVVSGLVLRQRAYRTTADALIGAGAVILYAAFYSAHVLYGLIPFGVSFALMGAVTAMCCVLALRNSSQWIAALGLAGGFATPLLLASDADRPIGLFGYVLLLDAGFLFVAGKRRWPSIGLVGLLGTFLLEALWMFGRMRSETFAIGLCVLALFAFVFVVFVALQPESERARWRLAQVGGVLLPFVLALYFAQHVDFGARLWPLALLCALLGAGASFVARKQDTHELALGAASASSALVLVWLFSDSFVAARAWELVACVLGLALVFHVFTEWKSAAKGAPDRARHHPAIVFDIGALCAFVLAAARLRPVDGSASPWPWLAGSAVIALLAARQAALSGADWLQLAAGVLNGVVWIVWSLHDLAAHEPLDRQLLGVLAIAQVVLFIALALVRRDAHGRAYAWHAAVLCGVLHLFLLDSQLRGVAPALALETMLMIGVCTTIAAAAAGASPWFGIALVLTMLQQSQWSFWLRDHPETLEVAQRASSFGDALRWLFASAVNFAIIPRLFPGFARTRAWVGRIGAVALVLWAPEIAKVFEVAYGARWRGLVPLALCVAEGLCAWRLARASRISAWSTGADARAASRTTWIWYASVALVFACATVPYQLDRDVFIVSAALSGCALAFLHQRTRHEPLAVVALAALVLATAVALGARLGQRFDTQPLIVFDWISYTYLVPALAAFGAAAALKPPAIVADGVATYEPLRADSELVRRHAATCASVCGLLLVFAWINLEIIGRFEQGPRFDLALERLPARDLLLSLAWALYALVLLALGVKRKQTGLRWASLAMLVLTIGKVFLVDLGQLEGLYRVGSMLGLALSLLFVSLLYQRFVFRARVVAS